MTCGRPSASTRGLRRGIDYALQQLLIISFLRQEVWEPLEMVKEIFTMASFGSRSQPLGLRLWDQCLGFSLIG